MRGCVSEPGPGFAVPLCFLPPSPRFCSPPASAAAAAIIGVVRFHFVDSGTAAALSAHAEIFSARRIVVDGNDGNVLAASNADAPRHPASLTKIMTLYLLFERLDAGKIKLDSRLKVSEHASEQAPTKLGLKPGQTISVEDAIKAVVTKSANDAAVTIAENLGGDEETYAKLMTQKARALGMAHTTYVNVSGLPDDDQVTTARDEALLGRDIQERFPQYYKYFSTPRIRLSRPRECATTTICSDWSAASTVSRPDIPALRDLTLSPPCIATDVTSSPLCLVDARPPSATPACAT